MSAPRVPMQAGTNSGPPELHFFVASMHAIGRRYNRVMKMRAAFLIFSLAAILPAQPPTANYDESKVPSYTLPDVLGSARDAKSWNARRQAILEIYQKEVFGRAPGKPAKMSFDKGGEGPALDGKALRKTIAISFGSGPK